MTMYDVMYDVITEQYENGDITFEHANELNDLAYDRYIIEKKTKADYRIQKFKKEFKYDPKDKSIEVNGERLPFNLKANTSKKYNSKTIANIDTIDNEITMNRQAFNDKQPKGYKFTIGHEYGHAVAGRMTPEEKEKEFDKYTNHSNTVKKQLIYNTDRLMGINKEKEERDNWDKKKRKYLKNLSEIETDNNPDAHDAREEEYYADDWGKKIAGKEVARKTLKNMKKYIHKDENRTDYDNIKPNRFTSSPSESLRSIDKLISAHKRLYNQTDSDEDREFFNKEIKKLNDGKKEILNESKFNKKNLYPVYRANRNRLVDTGMRERIKNVSNDKKDK